VNCGSNNVHISLKCGMVTRARKVVQLVGCAQDGLQMLVAKTGEKNLKQTKLCKLHGWFQLLLGM
jgi:hypothetical protein